MALDRRGLVLGINCAYHESAAALVRGNEVIFAVEEERFTRVKHAKQALVSNPDELPWNAIRACLEFVPERKLSRVDAIAYSLEPGRRLAMVGIDAYRRDERTGFGTLRGEAEFNRRVLEIPQILAREANDNTLADRFHFVSHHRAHAASAFFASPFPAAAILVVDGIGEESTAWLGRGSVDGLELIEEIPYPHSIGMLWERVAVYLGFSEFDACKVMGLAAYGDHQRFDSEFDELFPILDLGGGVLGKDEPPYRIDAKLARLRSDDVTGLESLFGARRSPEEPPTSARFAGVAAGLQRQTEEAVLALARRLSLATRERNLAFAGGVALNCVSNARLEREGPFPSLFLACAAHDAGTAIGAALAIAHQKTGAREIRLDEPRVHTAFLGPVYEDAAIRAAFERSGGRFERLADPAARAAALVAEGQIVGWFQGPLEFGPRALGNRSILADPRSPLLRDELNLRIKHREAFRPFGASVLAEELASWFRVPSDRPGAESCRQFMNLAYPVVKQRRSLIPAVVHRDGTCRVQVVGAKENPRFHSLISRFRELSGVPLVLNTSFNDEEPAVCSPDDAIKTFERAGIDALLLGDYLVCRPR
jgi:carbamoyltransferase